MEYDLLGSVQTSFKIPVTFVTTLITTNPAVLLSPKSQIPSCNYESDDSTHTVFKIETGHYSNSAALTCKCFGFVGNDVC